MTSELEHLAKSARLHGWVTANVPLLRIEYQASQLGWVKAATRKGDDAIAKLRPTTVEEAEPRSLSALHGLGEQPLHTDGAHLLEPPDIVILHAEHPNGAPTLLWSLYSKLTNPSHPRVSSPNSLRGGLFLVRSGSDRFLASAHAYSHGYRYDPACMSPCDERARDAVRYFDEMQAAAYRHEWTERGQLLVIDNRTALHARAAVNDNNLDRLLTRVTYRTKARE